MFRLLPIQRRKISSILVWSATAERETRVERKNKEDVGFREGARHRERRALRRRSYVLTSGLRRTRFSQLFKIPQVVGIIWRYVGVPLAYVQSVCWVPRNKISVFGEPNVKCRVRYGPRLDFESHAESRGCPLDYAFLRESYQLKSRITLGVLACCSSAM